MDTLLLAEHPCYRIERNDMIYIVRFRGYWDDDVIEQFSDMFKMVVKVSPSPLRGVLSDFREWEGGTPDFADAMIALLEWCVERGQSAAAFVLNSGIKSRAIEAFAQASRDEVSYELFHAAEIAYPWLVARVRQLESELII